MKWPSFKGLELTLLLIVVGGASFFRLYHLADSLMFRGDQGRDALIALNILKNHDIALIGPVTSVGNMYLGPFYYYFMVPFLALTYPNPIGPAIGVALVNCLSILGLYLVARHLFDKRIALVASLFYALMPNAIIYSRFSWNPNLGAPVAILLLWCLIKWYQTKQWNFALGLGLVLGVIIQLHYVFLITWGLSVLVYFIALTKDRESRKKLIAQGLTILAILILSMLPLIVFDFRHGHLISGRFIEFFTSTNNYLQPFSRLQMIVRNTEGRMYQLISQLISNQKEVSFDKIFSYISLAISTFLFFKLKKSKSFFKQSQLIVYGWLLFTIIGMAFYSSTVFNHYLTFCFPLLGLYWAFIIVGLWDYSLLLKPFSLLTALSLIYLGFLGFKTIPFDGPGTKLLEKTVQLTLAQVDKPYNLALLAENGDFQGMNYRYFFEVSDIKPQGNEDYLHLKNLVIIDEIQNQNPLSVPAYEIMAPGLTKLKTTFTVPNGPQVHIYQ